MAFALEVVNTVRREEAELFDAELEEQILELIDEAVACEMQFAQYLLGGGIVGLSLGEMRRYLEYCADQPRVTLGLPKRYGMKNPFGFMDQQEVQDVTNCFERRVSAYQVAVSGEVQHDAMPRTAAERANEPSTPSVAGLGDMPDSCYMWRQSSPYTVSRREAMLARKR